MNPFSSIARNCIPKLRNDLFRRMLWVVVSVNTLYGVTGCAIIPGQDAYSMRTESSLKLPAGSGDDVIPEYIKVEPINAELIIDLRRRVSPEPTNKVPPVKYSDYLLGPGDIISITVWEHPELTIPAGEFRSAEASGTLVSEEGTIYYPYVGVVKVAGLNLSQVRELLKRELNKTLEKVQLDVRVAAYRSKRIFVVGEVKSPGMQVIDDIPMTFVEAVSRAGGFTEEADYSRITLTRGGKTYRVDLQAVYEDGDTSQNILLVSGDVANVPDRQYNKVFVLGEVLNPGTQLMNKGRKSLAEAIGDADDINNVRANPHWIYVLRGTTEKPEIYHLDAKSPDALVLADQFPLEPRDIVYVDAAGVARWNRLITNILPSLTALNTFSDIPLQPYPQSR